MADEPISSLTLISPPPFSSSFTNPTTGAMLEILDTTNMSMASTGTNSKIAPGDLLAGYLAAGSNVTLTESSGIVTVNASGGFPLSTTQVYASVPSGNTYTIPSGAYGNLGTDVNLTLPTAGTYLIWGNVNANIYVSGGVAGNVAYVNARLYDGTNSVVVFDSNSTNITSAVTVFILGLQATVTVAYIQFQATATFAPLIYTVTGSTVIHLQGEYGTLQESGATNSMTFLGSSNAPSFGSGGNSSTFVTALRIY